MSVLHKATGTVLAACLASCTVGPNFTAPSSPVPPAFIEGDKAAALEPPATAVSEGSPDEIWWHELHDPELDRLEERTQKGNLDLQASLLRIIESRAQVQEARAQGLPTLNGVASYNREQLGAAGILKAQGGTLGGTALSPQLTSLLTSPINIFSLGFDASWELDLFGKVRRNVEAAKAQRDEMVESRNDMLVSLEAEVAQDYLQLRAAQLLRTLTLSLVGDEKQIVDLTLNRQVHGLAQESDVESARAQVSSLESQIPQYEQQIAAARHSLAVLIGETPETLDGELAAAADLPAVPAMIPTGLPASLARRRPDIREAEAALHAATANVGVSVASMYPDVSLTGTFGLRNISSGYLFDWASKFYTASPSISVPIFHGGALVASVKLARAEEAAVALNYRKTVLTALKEVEDGLVSLDQDGVRVAALKQAVGSNQRYFEITMHGYSVGLVTYISVLNAELQANQAKEQLAQASLTQLTDLVKLYKALGGGWNAPGNPLAAESREAAGAK